MSCAGDMPSATHTPAATAMPRIGDAAPDFTAMTTKGEKTD